MPDEIRRQYVVVVYDISDDRLRLRVAKFLSRMGLSRVQRSVFTGLLGRSGPASLEAGLRRVLRGRSMYSVHVYVLPRAFFDRRIVLEEGYSVPDEDLDFLV